MKDDPSREKETADSNVATRKERHSQTDPRSLASKSSDKIEIVELTRMAFKVVVNPSDALTEGSVVQAVDAK